MLCRSPLSDLQMPLDPTHDEVPRRRIHEVDVAAAEAAGQEDAVGALDEGGELLLGDAAADDEVVPLVALADPSPIERRVDEIGAEDDADVVELEALRGVDAADLLDPPRVARPEVGLRDAGRQATGLSPRVPGHRPVPHPDVGLEFAGGVGVGPRPAEAGDESSRCALPCPAADQRVELL